MSRELSCTWTVAPLEKPDQQAETFIDALVPGAVQLDWARSQGWPEAEHSQSWKQYTWMEDRCWLYRCQADVPVPAADQRLHFVCGGIDYAFQIRLSGRVVHQQEGMFTPVDLDLTDLWKSGDQLEVLVLPAPKSQAEPANRDQANQSCKPAVSYGWDFHPRLIPLGIWRPARLEIRSACCLLSTELNYRLNPGLDSAELSLSASVSRPGDSCRLKWTLEDPTGREVLQREVPATESVVLEEQLDDIQLWWPNGQGPQALYVSRVELLGKDSEPISRSQSRVGFRRIRMTHYPGQWDEIPNAQWPKGPVSVPVTLEVNGRRIFAKGSNWVCPDMFPGRLDDDRLREQVKLAAEANMNFLRCWGGAAVMPESFFDAADEQGILIWQEFPLSCNRYEGSEDYLRVLDAESRSIIRRLRGRTCLALWSGGNELFNKWSGMSPHDAAIRLLARNTYDLDPQRPFLMTAPLWGMGHGPYRFCNPAGRESFTLFQQCRYTAYTEFGVFASPSAESLSKWQDPSLLQLPGQAEGEPSQGSIARRHWEPSRYFKTETLEDFALAAGFMQRQGYKHLFEEIRRQKPRASMALNWCFNEPTPRVVNGSVIGWPCEIKDGYAGIRTACRPALASARIPRFVWQGGEDFEAEIWLLSDQPEPIEVESVQALLRCGEQEIPLGTWQPGRLEANSNLQGPTVRCRLPQAEPGLFELILRSEQDRLDSIYPLILGPLPVDSAGLYPA